MMYAVDENKNRVEARPNIRAFCPACGNPVYSACGDKNIWHFRHKSSGECLWNNKENESDLHRAWKKHFMKSRYNCEIEKRISERIADVCLVSNRKKAVIEIQKSSIDSVEINSRTVNYIRNGYNVAWLFDVRDVSHNFSLHDRKGDGKYRYTSFKWKWAKKYVGDAISLFQYLRLPCQVYLSIYPGSVFQIKKAYFENNAPKRGWGYKIPKDRLADSIIRNSNIKV